MRSFFVLSLTTGQVKTKAKSFSRTPSKSKQTNIPQQYPSKDTKSKSVPVLFLRQARRNCSCPWKCCKWELPEDRTTEHGTLYVTVSALCPTSSFNYSGSWFPHLQTGDNNRSLHHRGVTKIN